MPRRMPARRACATDFVSGQWRAVFVVVFRSKHHRWPHATSAGSEDCAIKRIRSVRLDGRSSPPQALGGAIRSRPACALSPPPVATRGAKCRT